MPAVGPRAHPRSTERAFRIINDGLHEVFEGRWLVGLFLAAAALTGVLCHTKNRRPL